jgi:hypothetical protein
MTADDIQIVREPGATKQGKKGRVYGGFYATANPDEAQEYAGMAGPENTVYEVSLAPNATVENIEGDITRLSPQRIEEFRARGVDVVVGKDVRGRTEHAIINKSAVTGLTDVNAAPVEAAPEAELTVDEVTAKIDSAVADGTLKQGLANVLYNKVQTGEMELDEISSYINAVTANELKRRMAAGEITREKAPVAGEAAEAAPITPETAEAAPAAREAKVDPVAPARGKMRMAERLAQLVPVIDSATTDLADRYELPVGPAGVQARNDVIQTAARQVGQTLGQDFTSKKTSKINLDRVVDKVMAEKGFKKKPKPKAAAPTPAAPAAPTPAAPAAPPPPPPPPPPSGGPAAAAPQPPKKPKPTKLTQKQLTQARTAAGLQAQKNSKLKANVARSKNVQALANNTSLMFAGTRGFEGPLRLLRAANDAIAPRAKRALAYALPSEDVVRLIGDRLPMVREVADILNTKLPAYRNGWNRKIDRIAREWTAFQAKNIEGGELVTETLKELDFNNVAPWTAPDAAAYIKADPELTRMQQKGVKPAAVNARKQQIRDAYVAWNRLGRLPKDGARAQKLAKDVIQQYRSVLEEAYRLERAAIESQGLPPAETRKLIGLLNTMYAAARERAAYVPSARYGEYWISLGADTKNPEFYMFESAFERNKVFEALLDQNKTATAPLQLKRGDKRKDVEDLITNSAAGSKLLKDFMSTVDANLLSGSPTSAQAADTLKSNFMQMYLLALPEASIRKQFVTRKHVIGASMDGLRDFYNAQKRSVSQLSRLKYARELRKNMTEAEEILKKDPRGVEIAPYFDSLQAHVNGELAPEARDGLMGVIDRMANLGSKFTFIWLLTSAKSALIQHTQVHNVALPALVADYGTSDVAATSARYMTGIISGQRMALFRRDNNGDVITDFDPNLRDTKFMQELRESDPAEFARRYKAWEYGNNRNAFADTYTTSIMEGASQPSQTRGVANAIRQGNPAAAAVEGVRAATRFMSGAFHHMESVNRQIVFMTAYDLEYAAAKKRGLDDKAAQAAAQEKALSFTRETMFNFSTFNKSEAAKQPLLKLGTQFMSYPVMMMSYLVRNFRNMIPLLKGDGKVAAAQRLFGTMGMTALYAGISGLPGYGMLWAILEGVRDAMTDDGEDPEFAPYMDDEGNVLGKVNLKFWFENSYLPSVFGPDSSVAEALNIDPETAVLLSRGVKAGIPAATLDLDVAGSISLSDLFFRNDLKADTLQGMFEEATFANLFGPAGSVVTNFGRAAQLFEEGEGLRAMELIMPAFFKGGVRATRLAEEGLKTPKGDTIRPEEFYTDAKLFYQTLGIGSAEAGEVQRQNIQRRDMERAIEDEKSQLITRLGRAYFEAMADPSGENLARRDELEQERLLFNRTYPTAAIGDESITRSVEGIGEERASSIEGARLNPAIPVGEDVLRRRLAQ